jgi:hypothetical protein
MTGGTNEVEAGVDTHVALLGTFGLLFLAHVLLVLVVDKLGDWEPSFLS